MDNGKRGELKGTYHMSKEHGRLARRISGEQPGLGRVVAQVFRHVRIRRFRAASADARQVVTRHPLQAVLVGVGLGYLLARR